MSKNKWIVWPKIIIVEIFSHNSSSSLTPLSCQKICSLYTKGCYRALLIYTEAYSTALALLTDAHYINTAALLRWKCDNTFHSNAVQLICAPSQGDHGSLAFVSFVLIWYWATWYRTHAAFAASDVILRIISCWITMRAGVLRSSGEQMFPFSATGVLIRQTSCQNWSAQEQLPTMQWKGWSKKRGCEMSNR